MRCRQLSLAVLVTAIVAAGLFAYSHRVYADAPPPPSGPTDEVPNPNDFYSPNGTGVVYAEVSTPGPGDSLDAPEDDVNLYLPTSQGLTQVVDIINADDCHYASNHSYIDQDPGGPVLNSYTLYQVNYAATNNPLHNGPQYYSTVDTAACAGPDNVYMTLDLTGATTVPYGNGSYYEVTLVAEVAPPPAPTSQGVNAFQVLVPGGFADYTANNPIYNPDDGPKFALQERDAAADNSESQFDLYFAPNCSATSTQSGTMSWYDADWGTLQTNSDYYWALWDLTTGQEVQRVSGAALGGGGAGSLESFTYQFVTGHQYAWQWNGVYRDNGIQFQLPFDGFNSGQDCPPPTQNPPGSPTLSNFTTVDGTFYDEQTRAGIGGVHVTTTTCGNGQFNSEPAYQTSNPDITDMATTPDGDGWWLVGSDGGVFSFGDANYYGSMDQLNPNLPSGGANSAASNGPITGITSTPDGGGYYLVDAHGDVYAFGDAHPNLGNAPAGTTIEGIAAAGNGYYLVGSDGGVFAIDTPGFYGSLPGNEGQPGWPAPGAYGSNPIITGIAASADGAGYWLVGSDGDVYSFGDVAYHGNGPGGTVGIARTSWGQGYYFVSGNGSITGNGDAFTFKTNANGDYYIPVQDGMSYCVGYTSGVPAQYTVGPFLISAYNAACGARAYESQVANASDGGCDLNTDNGLDFGFNVNALPSIPVVGTPSCTTVIFTAADQGNPGDTVTATSVTDQRTNTAAALVSRTATSYTYDISPWQGFSGETFVISATDSAGTSTTSFTVGPCATLSCDGYSPAGTTIAGTQFSLETYVLEQGMGGAGAPPPNPGGSYTVTFNGNSYSPGYTLPTVDNSAISSTAIPLNVSAGVYPVSWSFSVNGVSSGTCSGSLVVANEPYLQVYGGDTLAGGGSGDGCTQDNKAKIIGSTYYDAAEQDLLGAGGSLANLANSDIDQFPSDAIAGNGSVLALANTAHTGASLDTTEFGGDYDTGAPCSGDYYGTLPNANATSETTTTQQVDQLATGSYSFGNSVTLEASGTINNQVTIYVKGNVTIKPNGTNTALAYTPTGWTASTIPQLRVIATGNIYIDPGITALDGLYVAQNNTPGTGTIYTCSDDGSFPGYDACNSQLQVYGSFIANQVDFMRTKGNVASANTSPGTSLGLNWTSAGGAVCNGPCANPPTSFQWVNNATVAEQNTGEAYCTWIAESAEPYGLNGGPNHTWYDNDLCSNTNYNFAWASAGPIAGDTCNQWLVAGDPYTWTDNYLCWPPSENSVLGDGSQKTAANPDGNLFFSATGNPNPSQYTCMRIAESADTDDNGIWEATGTTSLCQNLVVAPTTSNDSCTSPDANAAEIFCYDPALWLASPPSGTITAPDSIKSLPPVL
jgi:hypothetical protein